MNKGPPLRPLRRIVSASFSRRRERKTARWRNTRSSTAGVQGSTTPATLTSRETIEFRNGPAAGSLLRRCSLTRVRDAKSRAALYFAHAPNNRLFSRVAHNRARPRPGHPLFFTSPRRTMRRGLLNPGLAWIYRPREATGPKIRNRG